MARGPVAAGTCASPGCADSRAPAREPGAALAAVRQAGPRAGEGCAFDPEAGGWVRPLSWLGDDHPLRRPLRSRRGTRSVELGEAIAQLRARGLEPHRLGPEGDPQFAEQVGRLLDLRDARAKAGGREGVGGASARPAASSWLEALHDGATLVGESSVTASPTLGVNKGRYPFADAGDGESRIYGTWLDILADVAAAGGGFVRQFESGDLPWAELFPVVDSTSPADALDARIPPPAQLYDQARDVNVLANFVGMFFASYALGIKLIPTLFTLGGGTKENRDGSGVRDPATGSADDGALYRDALGARATHESKIVIPTPAGWDPFYWEPAEVGVAPRKDALCSYHKLALRVSYADDLAGDDEAYSQECIRRKALAVAAYSAGIGEVLAILHDWLSGLFGDSIADVIAYLEVGNEMDAAWLATVETDKYDYWLGEGANHLARFHFLVAAPIYSACPHVKFRASGLASYGTPDAWPAQRQWLGEAFSKRIFDHHDFFVTVQDKLDCLRANDWDFVECMTLTATYGTTTVSATDVHNWWMWLLTCETAGFYWPPDDRRIALNCANYLHQAGFHWYHYYTDCDGASMGGYRTASHLVDHVDQFRADVVDPCTEAGLGVSIEVGEGGFPARPLPPGVEPGCDDEAGGAVHTTWLADPRVQAGMLVRTLVAIRAAGCENALWHTFMANIADLEADESSQGWTMYSCMGMREDAGRGGVRNFVAGDDAYRRPSWFAFRRLVWLLSHSRSVQVAHRGDGDGMTVVLAAKTGFLVGARSWQFAWITWMDPAESETDGPDLSLPRLYGGRILLASAYDLLSLVPEVDTTSASPGDPFPAGETVRWDWDGWDQGAIVAQGESGGLQEVAFVVRRIDGIQTFGPTCILTDADIFAPLGST